MKMSLKCQGRVNSSFRIKCRVKNEKAKQCFVFGGTCMAETNDIMEVAKMTINASIV